jgi:hypothetical protein
MKKFVVKLVKIKIIAVCEKTAGLRLRCGKFSNLNSACSKVLVPIKIFQFQDYMLAKTKIGKLYFL